MAIEARHRFGFSVRGDNLPIQSAAVFHPSGYGTPAEMLGGDPALPRWGPRAASPCRPLQIVRGAKALQSQNRQ